MVIMSSLKIDIDILIINIRTCLWYLSEDDDDDPE